MDPITLTALGALLGTALSEVAAGGKFGAGRFLGGRERRRNVRDALEQAEGWLRRKLPPASLEFIETLTPQSMKLVASAVGSLKSDADGRELLATISNALAASDPFDVQIEQREAAVPAFYEGLLRALAGSNADVSNAARVLLEEHLAGQRSTGLVSQLLSASTRGQRVIIDLLATADPPLDPPGAASPDVARPEAIASLMSALGSLGWLALYGSHGVGKTQLALKYARAAELPIVWIQLRDLVTVDAARRVRHSLQRANCGETTAQLIVLDDLPQIQRGDELCLELERLSLELAKRSARLVSTSNYRLPADLLARVNAVEAECPPFDERETGAFLAAAGAPPRIHTRPRFWHSISRGHPLLLSALASFLSRQQWVVDENALGAVLGGAHTKELGSELIGRIVSTVASEEAKRLLYRLRLVHGSFDDHHVAAVAAVRPRIESTAEALVELAGVWVERVPPGKLRLAAVLSALPDDTLRADTTKAVHRALGDHLYHQRVLGGGDLFSLITHYWSAEEYDRSAFVLLQALADLYTRRDVKHHHGLLELWGTAPLPEQLALELRIMLCGFQLALRRRFDLDTSQKVEELDRLVAAATPAEGWALAAMTASTIGDFIDLPVPLAKTLMARTLELGRDARLGDGTPFRLPQGLPLNILPVLAALWARTPAHVRVVAAALAALSVEGFDDVRNHELVEAAAFGLTERLAKAEGDTSYWLDLVDALGLLAAAARHLKCEVLGFRAVRTEALVRAEKLGDSVASHALLDRMEPASATGRFLWLEARARVLLIEGHKAEALEFFEQALGVSGHDCALLSIAAAIDGSFAAVDARKALSLLEVALARASSEHDYDDLNLFRIHGELAIAAHLAGDWRRGFRALLQAYDVLESVADERRDEAWKGAIVLAGAATTYILRTFLGDSPPIDKPQPTMMFGDLARAAQLFGAERRTHAIAILADFADAAGERDVADKWRRKASEPTSDGLASALTRPGLIWAAIENGDLDTAIKVSLSMPTGSVSILRATEYVCPPLALRIGRTRDRQSAANAAAKFRQMITVETDAGQLGQAAKILDAFENGSPAATVVALANEATGGLWTMAVLLASIDEALPYSQAYGYQVSVFKGAWDMFRVFPSLQGRLAVPFLHDFWHTALLRSSFQFRSPRLLHDELARTWELSPATRIRHVLRVVGDALGARLPANFRLWLKITGT